MAIAVRDLTKFYGSEKAVDNISFDVQTGEILGFLGPNGAGKTTTMKIVTCYLPPTSGSVSVDGLRIDEHSLEVRRKIGYLPEHNPLYFEMNVLEYLTYAGQLHTMAPDHLRSRLREMVELCGLGDVRHKDIGELSKGYRQRVGLAQAMIHDPQVLILDEPTSGLDPAQRVEIRALVRELAQGDVTVVLSTHVLSEVEAVCDRVIIVHRGKIIAQDAVDALAKSATAVQLRVARPDPALGAELSAIPGVTGVETAEDGLVRVVSDQDVREQVAAVAVSRGLLELGRQRALEDVFLHLTAEES
jgi:ABC-2 type transport system ATP-binding protein